MSRAVPAMLDKSGHFSFGDQRDSVNIALVNKGDQELYRGTGEIATFKVRAKRDGRLDFEWQAWLIGPEQDFVSFPVRDTLCDTMGSCSIRPDG